MKTVQILVSDLQKIENHVEELSYVQKKAKFEESAVKQLNRIKLQNKKIKKKHSIAKNKWKKEKNKLEKDVKKLEDEVKKIIWQNIRCFKVAQRRKNELAEEKAWNFLLYNESAELAYKVTELKTEIGKTPGCTVCLEKLHRKPQQPKILFCGHPICFECWSEIFSASQQSSRCPECGKLFFPDLYF